MTDKTPGFYLKYVICDEHDNPIVHSEPVRILTGREFYDQRFLPAHVANTYASFAAFMANASVAVNLVDSLTAFSRSNFGARHRVKFTVDAASAIMAAMLESATTAMQTSMDEEVIAELKKAVEEP